MKSKVKAVLLDFSPELADRFASNYTGADDVGSLNTYFRLELTKAPVSTMDERGCLMDGISEELWLEYFREHVAQTLHRFELL